MALLATQTPTPAGVVITRNAVSASDTFENSGRTLIEVVNGGAGALTVTIPVSSTVDGLAVEDRTVAFTAGQTKVLGPFPPGIYGSTVTLEFSATTSVTAAVIQVA